MVFPNGVLVTSLDFELYWGAGPKERGKQKYEQSLAGARRAVPSLLKLFEKYEIHATWALVGMLFFEDHDELMRNLPTKRPSYDNTSLSSYEQLEQLGQNEDNDPFHYASSLIKMIMSCCHQEIGTHTFSHYYCLEKGQNVDTFREDLKAAINIPQKYGLDIQSIVFPMNQVSNAYLSTCRDVGLTAYRGTARNWLEAIPSTNRTTLLLQRGLRLLDAYLNITGYNAFHINEIKGNAPMNIPASRFLRPYCDRFRIIEPVRLRRILSSLNNAARKRLIYHLWWHPYNFGINLEKNIEFLERILSHYAKLRDRYAMESLSMNEVAERVVKDKR